MTRPRSVIIAELTDARALVAELEAELAFDALGDTEPAEVVIGCPGVTPPVREIRTEGELCEAMGWPCDVERRDRPLAPPPPVFVLHTNAHARD